MNEEKRETIKFQSKDEIARCISALRPFCNNEYGALLVELGESDNFALLKIKELTKLL